MGGVERVSPISAKAKKRGGWDVKQIAWFWYVFFEDGILGSGSTKEAAIAQAEAALKCSTMKAKETLDRK